MVAPGVEARFRLRPALLLWKGAPCALAQPKAVTARAKRAVVGRMVVKGDDDVLRNVVGMRGVKLGAGVDELWGVGVSCVFLRGTAGGGTCCVGFPFFS